MIRSQIPLSLPPVPPAHKKKIKNLEAHLEERKACSCKWPRCQSSSGWRRESRSGLPESAIRGAHSRSLKVFGLRRAPSRSSALSLQFLKDATNFTFRDSSRT